MISERVLKTLQHADDHHFLVNTYSLHHPHLLRQVLPSALRRVIPLHTDREGFHIKIGEPLHDNRNARRAEIVAKRQATIAAKKAAKDAETAAQDVLVEDEYKENEQPQEDGDDDDLYVQ